MRTSIILCITILVQLAAIVQADQGYYVNSDAIGLNQEFLVAAQPRMFFHIRTSHTYLSDTTDSITFTAVGDFSSSGPHVLGSFSSGSIEYKTVTLDRIIGRLKEIIIFNAGSDGWLLSYMTVRILDDTYDMHVPKRWLGTQNNTNAQPNTHNLDIDVWPVMHLPVVSVIKNYHSDGSADLKG